MKTVDPPSFLSATALQAGLRAATVEIENADGEACNRRKLGASADHPHSRNTYTRGLCEWRTRVAKETGAELWLSGHDEGEDYQYGFPHREIRDGDDLRVGDLRIVAVHTPGHTPEHLSFLAYEQSRCGQPVALFSGNFLFVGSLGGPDLQGEAETEARRFPVRQRSAKDCSSARRR